MASPWGWGNDETSRVSNYYNTFVAGGPTGAVGPAGSNLGFTQNDRQGRASLQTSTDLYGQTILPPSVSLGALHLLESVLYTEDGNPPYRTPVTQASILNVLNTYGGGQDELGPFQVDGLASGTGTIELESSFGFLVSAIQGLGLHPASQTTGVLSSSGSISYISNSNTTSISATGVSVSTGTQTVIQAGPVGLDVYSTYHPNGTGIFSVLPQSNLTQLKHSGFTLGTYALPTGTYTGTAENVRDATFILASDVTQSVYIQLPSNRPIGTLFIVKKNSTQNHHIYVVVQDGGTMDGVTTYDMGLQNYVSKGFISLGNGSYSTF